MVAEIWKDIEDYEGIYQVSNLGNIRSLDRVLNGRFGKFTKKGKVLNLASDKDGYKQIGLTNKHRKRRYFRVHRLVAQAFVLNPDPENKDQVNHINGVKDCNEVWNLEWVSQSENMRHAVDTGLVHTGHDHHRSKLTSEQVAYIRSNYIKGHPQYGQRALGRMFGMSPTGIRYVLDGISYKPMKSADVFLLGQFDTSYDYSKHLLAI